MDLMKIASELFLKHLSGNAAGGLDLDKVSSAMQNLLPTAGGDLDLGALIAQFSGGDLGGLVQSFLGDGANNAMSGLQIAQMFGEDKVSNFASSLNIEPEQAATGLSEMIPNLIDKNSQGGALNDALGGVAGKLLGGMFS